MRYLIGILTGTALTAYGWDNVARHILALVEMIVEVVS